MTPTNIDEASRPRPARRRSRILLSLLWVALACVFVLRFHDELLKAVGMLPELRFAVLTALVLFTTWTFVAAAGWRTLLNAALPADAKRCSLLRLVMIRVQAQALNFILPTAGLAGESLRALSAVDRPEAVRASVVSTVLDNVAMAVAGITLAAASVPLLIVAAHGPWQTGLLASSSLILLGVVLERVPFVLSAVLLPFLDSSGKVASLLRILAQTSDLRPAHRRAVAWHLLERAISVGEVHVVMIVLDVPATIADSTAITTVFVLASFLVFFVPAQLGVAEIGVVMACVSLGMTPEVGIGVALVRRSRQLVVCVAGLLLLLRARLAGNLRDVWAAPGRARPTFGGWHESRNARTARR